ncbi:hypothetical protein BDW59DRAFT_150531 [Aspergillus cavernicola]|uniref:Uncharacterized protein n=1 Tax=Aspergillus cavernicola TaxID=176166 RepID=A0ABR4HZ58_9EURO
MSFRDAWRRIGAGGWRLWRVGLRWLVFSFFSSYFSFLFLSVGCMSRGIACRVLRGVYYNCYSYA